MDGQDDMTKYTPYESLKFIYKRCSCHDVSILPDDLNASMGKAGIFVTVIDKFSFHEETSLYGLIDFVGGQYMFFCSARFQHMKIHQVITGAFVRDTEWFKNAYAARWRLGKY